jgi:cell division protein FtsQ
VTRFLDIWQRWWRRLAVGAVLAVVVSAPWWGRAIARQLAFFRVRRVEIVGVRYVSPNEVLGRLKVDTTASVWDDPTPWRNRVAQHPQIRTVTISRKLPGTLIVHVEENVPVALVSGPNGFSAYDERGTRLPLDPSRVAVDLPVLVRRDPVLLRFLAAMREMRPALYARVSDVRRVGEQEMVMHFGSLPVRAMADVTVDRLDDIIPVEADLAKRQARVSELDLRYRDQVIARLQ